MRFVPRELLDIGYNKRALTFEDCEKLCARLGVVLLFADPSLLGPGEDGMHFRRRGRPVIVLNKRLTGFMLLWVAWHEVVHFLLHPTDLRFFARGTENKFDAEANRIATCCVIPRPMLIRILKSNDADQWLYPRELMRLRCEIFAHDGE